MPTPQETAYLTLKTQIPKETLERVYTPSAAEIAFVKKHSRTPQIRACMLTQLKCATAVGPLHISQQDPPMHTQIHRKVRWLPMHSENAE
ncbi:MAG: DUF4158 domain-containing protein [Desulfovibrionaceae bacterium]|nr:DUF4158 domain-containing protein [Desulfovibrionaceae bacterium]